MTEAEATARAVIEAAAGASKPLVACWMGQASTGAARKLLNDARIPVFRTPEPAVEMFAHVAAYYRNQRTLLQAPGPAAHQAAPDLRGARLVIDGALAERRKLLSETESKALLAAFHIPIAQAVLARSARDAMLMAQEMGFPVAMKIDSPDIAHKSDVGGVRLGIADAEGVRAVYKEMLDKIASVSPKARRNGVTVEPMIARPHGRELIVGVIRDPVFGPAITVGMGGTAVEVLRDRGVALPPLNAFLVKTMIGRTRLSRLLGAFRRMPEVDMAALESVLLRVSEMVCELPQLEEFEINPLIVDESGAVALDARAVVKDPQPMRGRYAHMAIHPYPADLVEQWALADGTPVEVRPIRPEDAEMEQRFVKNLSERSRYFRFMNSVRELTPAMLTRFTQIDYDREMAFIVVWSGEGGDEEIAVARYVTNPDGRTCEFAVVVADAWQQRGIGRRLLETLITVARSRGLETMVGHVLAANDPMLSLCVRLGFRIGDHPQDATVRRATLALSSAENRAAIGGLP
jgi:acetyltransferase